MKIEIDWPVVVMIAAALVCAILAWQFGVEWLIGAGLSAAGAASRRRDQSTSADDAPDANPTDVDRDDYERDPIPPTDHEAPTPRSDDGDDLDRSYWREQHRRGTGDDESGG